MRAPAFAGFQPRLRDSDALRKAKAWIAVLGGNGNIVRLDPCAETRLRVVVREESQANEDALRKAGVNAVAKLDAGVFHLLVDLNADQYAAEMKGQLAAAPVAIGANAG